MIHAYSQRLSPPYTGQVQIADAGHARALTLDGRNWEIQFQPTTIPAALRAATAPGQHAYVRVALLQHGEIRRHGLPAFVDPGRVDDSIAELVAFIADANLPFAACDHYEYWLLDGQDGSPLALIRSCSRQEQMPTYPATTEWTALPASLMEVERTAGECDVYVPPVNYRLERLVAERAGRHPRARWFNRLRHTDEVFPPFLVSERWQHEADAQLCRRYIARQAPRLLMLHGLDSDARRRLELDARSNALEVDRFYPLYPAVADDAVVAAIRVEANLRKAAKRQS